MYFYGRLKCEKCGLDCTIFTRYCITHVYWVIKHFTPVAHISLSRIQQFGVTVVKEVLYLSNIGTYVLIPFDID